MAAQEASQYGLTVEEMEAMADMQAEFDKDDDAQESSSAPASPNAAASRVPPRSRAVIPEGAMPSRNGVLSQHAAEFWFPECRNCPCCKGFKHGCACRSPIQDTCSDLNCVDPEHATAVRARVPSQPPTPSGGPASGAPLQHPSPHGPDSGRGGNSSPQGHYSPSNGPRGAPGPGAGDESSVPCKFFNSSMGCRFGSSCRNAHSGPSGGGGGSYMPQYPPRGMPSGPGPMYPPNPMMQGRAPMSGPMGGMPQGSGPGMGGPMNMGMRGGGGMDQGPPGRGYPPQGPDQPCVFFQQGNCRFGSACRYAHGGH